MRSTQDALTGEIFEEYTVLSVDELSRLCARGPVHTSSNWWKKGVLSVNRGRGRAVALRPATALRRARTALRLQRDPRDQSAGCRVGAGTDGGA